MRELKKILQDHGVNFAGITDKDELVALIVSKGNRDAIAQGVGHEANY